MTIDTLATIAWRNIWRNRRRTILTLMAIAFATTVLVFFVALQLSSYSTSINATVGLLHGHMQIQREGYLKKPQMRKSFGGLEKIEASLNGIKQIAATAPRASSFALISSEDRAYGAQILGVVPERERAISSIPGVIREGRYLSSDDTNAVVMGSALAANLKIGTGDEITLLGQGRDGSLAAQIVQVVGLFVSGSRDVDRLFIQMPLSSFSESFSMDGQIHQLVVKLKSLDDVEAVQFLVMKRMSNRDNLLVLRWDQLVPGLKQSIELDMASGWIFFSSLILIVGFSVLNTFLMSVLERTKEFGVLLALGTKPSSVCTLIISECMFLSLVGALIGIFFGGALVAYFGAVGFSVPGADELMAKWNLPAVLYPRLEAGALLSGPLIIIGTSALATLYPALKVLDIEPKTALEAS